MVFKIAHQEEGCLFLCFPEIIPRSTIFPQKNSHGILPRFHPSPVPDTLRRLVPRRPPRRAVG
jgi:hypothetical protein